MANKRERVSNLKDKQNFPYCDLSGLTNFREYVKKKIKLKDIVKIYIYLNFIFYILCI